ncbi:MAG: hypothetical protein U0W24_00270 [Bacteroidales bacterium]
MQYKAGYFLNSIFDLFLNPGVKEKVEKIVFQLSHFDLETSAELQHRQVNYDSEIKIVNNLISRGIPTLPGLVIEEELSAAFGNTKKEISALSEISYPFTDESLSDEIYRAIHIIDPRIDINSQKPKSEKNQVKENNKLKLLYSLFSEYLNEAYIQLYEENRTFGSIVKSGGYHESEGLLQKYNEILNETVEFSIEMPYVVNNTRGISFEFSESPIEARYKYEKEQLKKALCETTKWTEPFVMDTLKLSESNTPLRPLLNFSYNEYFDTIARNYKNPLYASPRGQKAMQYALSPVLVARIQKTIIEYLLSGKKSLDDKEWKIAAIERDVPGTVLALKELITWFEHIFNLKGKNQKLPAIKLSLFVTEDFAEAGLNRVSGIQTRLIKDFDENAEFDLLLDVSVLQRKGILNETIKTRAKNIATIRSVRSIESEKHFLVGNIVEYKYFETKQANTKAAENSQIALKFFLRNLFRKDNFLPGQQEIISRILCRKNVLGNLPVSGGKSLSWQIASLLQPGFTITLVPDGLTGKIQIQQLEKLGLENALDFNYKDFKQGTISEKLEKLYQVKHLIIIITPEILRTNELRNGLAELTKRGFFFNQFVIEEAHSISAWSHTFIPTYCKTAELKEIFVKNPDNQKLPSVVLSSVMNVPLSDELVSEFQIEKENIVKINRQTTNVNFQVIDAESGNLGEYKTLKEVKQNIGKNAHSKLAFYIKENFPDERDKNSENRTLVICPEPYGITGVSDKNRDGVADKITDSFSKLKLLKYIGTENFIGPTLLLNDISESNKSLEKFDAGQFSIMVAYPGFATGVNKIAIKNMLYFYPPKCLEDFIHISQKAGWDKTKSNCTILIDKQKPDSTIYSYLPDYIKDNGLSASSLHGLESLAKNFRGKLKEINVINELLNGIKTFTISHPDLITDEIETYFGIKSEIVFHPKNKPSKIYLSSGEKNYGFIDLSTFIINTDESSFDKKLSLSLLQFLSAEIRKRCAGTENCLQLLLSPVEFEHTSIIETYERIKTGETAEIGISFENNLIAELSDFMQKEFGKIFNRVMVRNLYLSSCSAKHFLSGISAYTTLDEGSWYIEKLTKYYENIRSKEDTCLAINRLSQLGIIDDFVIDGKNQQFVIKMKKKTAEAYLIKLFNIFDNGLLEDIAEKRKKNLKKTKQDVSFTQIVEEYISFIYEVIVSERVKSIELLDRILLQVYENKENRSNFNLWIQELMSNYFGAKYINRFFGIIKASRQVKEEVQYFEIVRSTLDQLGHSRDNWEQLKKSIEIVSKMLPNNPIPYFFDAYIKLINEKQDEKSGEQALDQIARGLIKMRKQAAFKIENYKENIEVLMDHLYEFKPELKEKYNKLVWLRMHYIWLKDFNKTEANG